jgi:hypothetical protein
MALLTAAPVVAACGSSDSKSTDTPAAAAAPAAEAGGVPVAEAKTAVEPYIGKASAFPLEAGQRRRSGGGHEGRRPLPGREAEPPELA